MKHHHLSAAAFAVATMFAAPVSAQTTGESCSKLQTKYDEDIRTANTLVMDLTKKILSGSSTPDVLSKLGLDVKSLGSPEQAIRKGVVAAMSPPVQNAILIHLLSANTTMQTMAWKGCKPSGN
ncbi:hypothetical protein [Rhodospirillaceae bacterium SYSU D60014]|uniref:hypothetical protein n=1 Tax=Virgifigura deserti TaxID=2268457 RepID=UPI000E66DF45